MTRFADIEELLAEVDAIVVSLREMYAVAKQDASVASIPRVKVKSSLEHLRSALDYAAGDIFKKAYGRAGHIHFPYGKDKILFDKSIKTNAPKLEQISPALFRLVESIQPHKMNDSWLSDLARINNSNKHNELSSQKKSQKRGSLKVGRLVEFAEGATGYVTFNDCYGRHGPIGAGSQVKIGPHMSNHEIAAQLNPALEIPIERTAGEIKFLLDGTNIDALEFIELARVRVGVFIDELYRII